MWLAVTFEFGCVKTLPGRSRSRPSQREGVATLVKQITYKLHDLRAGGCCNSFKQIIHKLHDLCGGEDCTNECAAQVAQPQVLGGSRTFPLRVRCICLTNDSPQVSLQFMIVSPPSRVL